MRTPLVLFLLSIVGLAASVLLPRGADLVLLAGPSALASLGLYLRARRAGPPAHPRWIVVDGSNVMYWNGDTPRIEPIRAVLRRLEALGFTPGVVFDANAGHLLDGRYRHDRAFARKLGLPLDRVMVVDKGSPADPVILQAASDLGAPILSNDRFRDWADRFPVIRRPGRLVRGGYRDGRLWLDLDRSGATSETPRPAIA